MTRGRGAILLALSLVLAAWGALPFTAGATDFSLSGTTIYFKETGHNLSGDFLKTWQANGGLMTLGYPISDPIQQDNLTVQYFERARLEAHPENQGTPYVVLGTLLGSWVGQSRQKEAPFQPLPASVGQQNSDPGRRFFPETGHTLSYGFKKYWDQNGGLFLFGYPISEEFSEKNPDTGQVYTVQYFERARFEYHPEQQGTRYEVLLGRLGVQYAQARSVSTAASKPADGAVAAFPGLLDPNWSLALRTQEGWAVGIITADTLNIRSGPSTSATITGRTYARHPIEIQDIVNGESVNGVSVWYKVGDSQYVAASWVIPFVPDTPPATYSGHWIDVSLTRFYAVAYDGERPVYAAIITAGRDDKTPPGVYRIQRRVEDETMDSATVGIPKGDPHYYYLEHVMYTQYFLSDGFAVHGNWWTDPSNYGGFTSNGCVGLQNADALWYWNFLNIGSTVQIHF